jgi:hypothetical protein
MEVGKVSWHSVSSRTGMVASCLPLWVVCARRLKHAPRGGPSLIALRLRSLLCRALQTNRAAPRRSDTSSHVYPVQPVPIIQHRH